MASARAELMKAIAATNDALLIIDSSALLEPERPGLRVWVRTPGESGLQTVARILAAETNNQPTSSA